MNIEIVKSSREALAASAVESRGRRTSYPFKKLTVGMSFTVPVSGANLRSLRTLASRRSTNGVRYVVVVHADEALVEVARVE